MSRLDHEAIHNQFRRPSSKVKRSSFSVLTSIPPYHRRWFHLWHYSLTLTAFTRSAYTFLCEGGTTCSGVYWLWLVSHHAFAGGEEAQELSGTRPFYALLHTLQEPWAQLSGKQARLCLPVMSVLHSVQTGMQWEYSNAVYCKMMQVSCTCPIWLETVLLF